MSCITAKGEIRFTVNLDNLEIVDPLALLYFLNVKSSAFQILQNEGNDGTNNDLPSENQQVAATIKEPPKVAGGRPQGNSINRILEILKKEFGDQNFAFSDAIKAVKKETGLQKSSTQAAMKYGCDNSLVFRTQKGHYSFNAPPAGPPQINNGKHTRQLSNKALSRLRTLENEMLFKHFVNKLNTLNPDIFDEAMVDRTLEPGEALDDLKRKYPHLIYGPEVKDFREEYRDYLDTLGISNKKMQDLVIAAMESNEPYSDEEIKQFAGMMDTAKKKAEENILEIPENKEPISPTREPLEK